MMRLFSTLPDSVRKLFACAWGYYYVVRYIWAALNLLAGD